MDRKYVIQTYTIELNEWFSWFNSRIIFKEAIENSNIHWVHRNYSEMTKETMIEEIKKEIIELLSVLCFSWM